jgi:glycosyltransferase involved in cell wall biosynthesis
LNRIISILPKGEGFSPQQFGAVALCVRDFAEHSRYKLQTIVTGTLPGSGFAGIRYVALPQTRWFESRTHSYVRQCMGVIRDEQAALVEIHNRPNMLRYIAPRVSCKMALHLHNDPQEMQYTRTASERSKLLHYTDAVYCVSGYVRNRFLEGLDDNAQTKVHVVHNGIEIPASLPAKEKIIVFAGRMTEGKGALLLAEALRIALPQLPDWRAALIGSRRHSASQALTPHEKSIAAALQPIASQTELPGFMEHTQVLAYFARAAVAVIPSVWQEPFGRTAIEAMASGCAVISSGRGGLREVTQDAAMTLDNLTVQALADAVLVLASDSQMREQLQCKARERAMYFAIAERTRLLDEVRATLLGQ